VAREVAALTGKKLKLPPVNVAAAGGDIHDHLNIEIAAPDLCLRYAARVLTDIRIAPSPDWMQRRLLAAGMRPINNIVDVTNYVMLETGQPLHAFDYTRLAERRIIVRRAAPDEVLVTLDGNERRLTPEMLVIADAEKPAGLAGIMGGLASEITEATTTVMLESACFHNINIRRTARRLGIRSEASLRFEKGVDPNGVLFALERACHLIQEMGAGVVVEGIIDLYPEPVTPWEVTIRPSRIRELIGAEASDDFIRSTMERLQLEVLGSDSDSLTVRVPTFRSDLRLEADFVEEVARLFGFDRVPATNLEGTLSVGHKPLALEIEDRVKEILRGCGLDEVQTYSFVHPAGVDKLRLALDDPRRRLIRLLYPISEEQSVLRTSLLPSLLEVAALNQRRTKGPVNVFEVNRVYWPGQLPLKELPAMPRHLAVVLAGAQGESSWRGKAPDNDFYRVKGILEVLVHALRVSGEFTPSADPSYHPGRQTGWTVDNRTVAVLGEVHPEVAEAFGLSGRIYALELNLDLVLPHLNLAPRYHAWPRFPGVERDLALLVPVDVPAGEVFALLREAGGPNLTDLKLFDLYTGEQIPEGYKSLAYSLTFQSADHTLTDQEVDPLVARIVQVAGAQLGARVRG
ncbi:MAG TPA: phenylalanine--tRNA ligase subunit beta, partial [Firmicutes bacterium]|nr:phenylalanine--tRNA ligase subunit beta [Bacillota bacterium]